MITLSTVSDGAAKSGYYKAEGYYKSGTDEADASSRWYGKGAENAGLSGRIDDATFSKLLDGQAPNGQIMGRIRDGERQHRAGEDITFSAPKSVSFAALVLQDERVLAAHDRAVDTAMAYVQENLIETRKSINGETQTFKAPDIIAGLFRHDTSRLLDPNLHTHAVITNMVKMAGDERYRAILNDQLYRNQKTIDAVYINALARELHKAGFETERVGVEQTLRIKGIPDYIEKQFSKRSAEIEQALEDKGYESNPTTRSLAALATRSAKHGNVDRAALLKSWEDEARHVGWNKENTEAFKARATQRAETLGGVTRDDPVARHRSDSRSQGGPTQETRDAIDFMVSHLSERASIYLRDDVVAGALSRAPNATFEDVTTEIERRLVTTEMSAVRHGGEDYMTDKDTLERERLMLAALKSGGKAPALKLNKKLDVLGRVRQSPETLLKQRLNDTTLTTGQKEAIVTGLTDKGRFVGVQGYAGTGKTFMLDKFKTYAERHGYQVEGLAPSNEAVRVLSESLLNSETVTARLNRQDYRPDKESNKKTILVVDEASMLSTAQMNELMTYANQQRFARVVLVGDQKQLDAVGAGAAFAQLQRGGLRVAVMDDIQRQRDPQLLDAVKYAIAGDVTKAFENITRIQKADEISKAAAETWLSMRLGQRKNVGVIALTNNARKEINLLIRDGLKAQGLLAQDDVKVAGLSPLGLTRAEKGDVSSYAKGDIVVPIRSISSKNLKANHQYEIVDQNIQANTITLQALGASQRVTLTLSQRDRISGNLSGNRPEVRGFAAGDEVRFTITDKENGVLNAMRGTLDVITDKAITLTTPEGKTIDVPRSSIGAAGMDHAYALTAHGFQGQTVDKIILTMSSREQLATQKAFYVGISRAKDVARLITDDPVKLSDRLHKMTGERPAALDALAQAERDRFDRNALSKEAGQVRDDKTKDKIDADMRVEKAIHNIDKLQSEAREKWGPDLADREIGERTR